MPRSTAGRCCCGWRRRPGRPVTSSRDRWSAWSTRARSPGRWTGRASRGWSSMRRCTALSQCGRHEQRQTQYAAQPPAVRSNHDRFRWSVTTRVVYHQQTQNLLSDVTRSPGAHWGYPVGTAGGSLYSHIRAAHWPRKLRRTLRLVLLVFVSSRQVDRSVAAATTPLIPAHPRPRSGPRCPGRPDRQPHAVTAPIPIRLGRSVRSRGLSSGVPLAPGCTGRP